MKSTHMICSAVLVAISSLHAISLYPNEEGDDMMKAAFGGFIAEPNSGHGTIKVYSKQNSVSTNELNKAFAEACSDQYHFEFEIVNERPSDGVRIELIDGDGENTLLIYPDACRAVIDVKALSKDKPSSSVLCERTRKTLLRAFIYLAGAVSFSEPDGTLVDAMISLQRLDAAKEKWPPELTMRIPGYLSRSGVKPWDRMAYQDACEMGIAPAPRNSAQKKVWDKVHAIPTEPIKIKYEKPAAK